MSDVTDTSLRPSGTNLEKVVFVWQKGGIYISMVLLAIGLSFLSPQFFTRLNLVEVVGFASVIAIMTLGQTFAIAGHGIDLSVGAQVSLIACTIAWLSQVAGIHPIVAIFTGMAMAVGIGALYGIIVVKTGVPDLVVTLAGMQAARGAVFLLYGDGYFTTFAKSILFPGQARLGGFSLSVWILFIFALISIFILRKTFIGRYILAIGGNRKAAEYSGISFSRYKIYSYMFCGFFTGLATWIFMGRLNATATDMAIGMEMNVIISTVIGGTVLHGGTATFAGSIGGAIFITLVRNGMILGGIGHHWYMVFLGILLVISVSLTEWLKRIRH